MAVETDAFTGGIAPGGLRTKNDIRILLCYLLSSVGAPIRRDDIIRIMQENSLCNYFEVTEALSDLIQKGAIQRDPQEEPLLTAGPMAREIAEQLTGTIPLSVRDKAVSAALNLLAQAKREKENRVEIKKTGMGYMVTCHVSGGDIELMQFSLYAPDLYQARLIKHQFHSDPECVYRILLAAVTGNSDLAEDSIRRMNLHTR